MVQSLNSTMFPSAGESDGNASTGYSNLAEAHNTGVKMEILLIWQISSIFGMLFLIIFFTLLPLKIFRKSSNGMSKKSERIMSFSNCFSGGVFLSACFIQLIPYLNEKYQKVYSMAGWDPVNSFAMTQLTVMGGFFLIVIIEQVVHACQERKKKPVMDSHQLQPMHSAYISESDSTGSDESDTDTLLDKKKIQAKKRSIQVNGHTDHHSQHGHSHEAHGHSHMLDLADNQIGLRSIVLLLALSIHSVFEGLALGLQDKVMAYVNLVIGVAAHEFLMAFALGVNLAKQHLKVWKVLLVASVFSFAIPVGLAIGIGIGEFHSFTSELSSAIIQGIAAGTFVYVVFFEILPPEVNSNQDRIYKTFFILLGFGVITCLKFFMGG